MFVAGLEILIGSDNVPDLGLIFQFGRADGWFPAPGALSVSPDLRSEVDLQVLVRVKVNTISHLQPAAELRCVVAVSVAVTSQRYFLRQGRAPQARRAIFSRVKYKY